MNKPLTPRQRKRQERIVAIAYRLARHFQASGNDLEAWAARGFELCRELRAVDAKAWNRVMSKLGCVEVAAAKKRKAR